MKKSVKFLKDLGYHFQNNYWVCSLYSGFDFYIKLGRKTKYLQRARDWFVKPSAQNQIFRNYECLQRALEILGCQVEALNKLDT